MSIERYCLFACLLACLLLFTSSCENEEEIPRPRHTQAASSLRLRVEVRLNETMNETRWRIQYHMMKNEDLFEV